MQHWLIVTACQVVNSSNSGFSGFYQSAEHTGFKKATLLGQLLINLLRCSPTFQGLRGILLGLWFGSSREVGGVGQGTRLQEPSLIQSTHTYAHTQTHTRTQQAKADRLWSHHRIDPPPSVSSFHARLHLMSRWSAWWKQRIRRWNQGENSEFQNWAF